MTDFYFTQTVPWLGMGRKPDLRHCADPAAKLRALMIFVDFPNHRVSDVEAPYNEIGYYKEILAEDGKRVLCAVSEGRLDLTIVCAERWYTMPQNDADYKMERVITHEAHAGYIADACDVCADDYDLDSFDIFYVVPVKGSAVPYSPTMVSKSRPVCGKRAKAGLCVTFGEDMHFRRGLLLAHETGHILGLPDYYAFQCERGREFAYCGGWSLMGLIEGFAPDWFAYDKWRLGFLPDEAVEVLDESGEFEVKMSFGGGGKRLMLIPLTETCAVAVEARWAAADGLDKRLAEFGGRGIVMYELDGTKQSGYGCLTVIPKKGYEEYLGKLNVRECRELVCSGENVSHRGVTASLTGDVVKITIRK